MTPAAMARIAEGHLVRWSEVLSTAARMDPEGVARAVDDDVCAAAAVVLRRAGVEVVDSPEVRA